MAVECPNCHQRNDDHEDLCVHCGSDLVIRDMVTDGLNVLQSGRQVVSPRQCPSHPDANVQLENDRLVCSECGCDLGGLDSQNVPLAKDPPSLVSDDLDADEGLGKAAVLEVEGGQEIFFRGAYTTKVPFKGGNILVGRRDVMASHYPDIDLMMYRKLDPAISRRHLRFFRENEHYYIEDLCNNNATFLNDYANKLNHERRELHHGDRIFVSMSLAFLFKIQE